jgi:hypothetical protein
VDAFSYLSVLLSIILGLGLTQLLTAAGRLIRHRDRVRPDWLPLLWAVVLLVMYVQSWWAMFGLRALREWTFVIFLTVLAQTITLYMMAALILPEQIGDDAGVVDLRAYYDRHHRWFFGFFLATLIVSLAKDLLITGHLPDSENVAFHVVLAAACILAIVLRGRRVHAALGLAGAAAIVLYIALLFARLH